MNLGIIIVVIGVLLVVDSLFPLFFTNLVLKTFKKWSKKDLLKLFGVAELILGIILVGLGFLSTGS
tara:strand:- start:136 stop:333 length:198 start_codon:yes stop_codon:yes gene_type:complete